MEDVSDVLPHELIAFTIRVQKIRQQMFISFSKQHQSVTILRLDGTVEAIA
jgi:hypothetical protein